MVFIATITGFPNNTDPINLTVEATLTDGTTTMTRGYSLPASDNPSPSDFEALIQADIDQINDTQAAQEAFKQAFTSDKNITLAIETKPAAEAVDA